MLGQPVGHAGPGAWAHVGHRHGCTLAAPKSSPASLLFFLPSSQSMVSARCLSFIHPSYPLPSSACGHRFWQWATQWIHGGRRVCREGLRPYLPASLLPSPSADARGRRAGGSVHLLPLAPPCPPVLKIPSHLKMPHRPEVRYWQPYDLLLHSPSSVLLARRRRMTPPAKSGRQTRRQGSPIKGAVVFGYCGTIESISAPEQRLQLCILLPDGIEKWPAPSAWIKHNIVFPSRSVWCLMPPDLGDKYLQVLKHGQGIEEQATLEVLRDRLVGSVYPIELMMEMGRWFEPSEIKVVTVPELLDMNPYAAMGKRFRCKVMNDGL